MRDDVLRAIDRSTCGINRMAEISDAAYSVLLRSGIRGWWIDLELDIWKTLEDVAVKPTDWNATISRDSHCADLGSLPGLHLLTQAVYSAALRHGFHRPFVDVELGLYRALEQVMSRSAQPGC